MVNLEIVFCLANRRRRFKVGFEENILNEHIKGSVEKKENSGIDLELILSVTSGETCRQSLFYITLAA
jgi:methionine synthase II (cobalamin-independent)